MNGIIEYRPFCICLWDSSMLVCTVAVCSFSLLESGAIQSAVCGPLLVHTLFATDLQSHEYRRYTWTFRNFSSSLTLCVILYYTRVPFWQLRKEMWSLTVRLRKHCWPHSTGRSAQCFVSTWRGGIGRVGGRRKREEIWGYMYMYSWFTLL